MRWKGCTEPPQRCKSAGVSISEKIGVSITTRNRRPVLMRSLMYWEKYMTGDTLILVDDASDESLSGFRTLRSDTRLGVAMSKNRGIAALMDAGCDHLFLVDDDLFPTSSEWWRPYVESPEPHLSHQSKDSAIGGDDEHFSVEFPLGYMLYAERRVIDEVGGMDPAFGAWGGEHVEWQRRIHEAGLTTWMYADVRGSNELWHAEATSSTVGGAERAKMLIATGFQWQKPRPRFVPYTEGHKMQDYSLGPKIPGPRAVLRTVLDLVPSGTAVEFGVGNGESTHIIADRMPVVGFDSGEGLPEDWRPEYPKGSLAFEIPSVENATLVKGWFDDTLPGYDFGALGYIGLVHLDADLYSSTKEALTHIGPYLRPGCYVVFDEFHGYPGSENHEFRAWKEFADETGIGWTVIGHGDQPWAIRIG